MVVTADHRRLAAATSHCRCLRNHFYSHRLGPLLFPRMADPIPAMEAGRRGACLSSMSFGPEDRRYKPGRSRSAPTGRTSVIQRQSAASPRVEEGAKLAPSASPGGRSILRGRFAVTAAYEGRPSGGGGGGKTTSKSYAKPGGHGSILVRRAEVAGASRRAAMEPPSPFGGGGGASVAGEVPRHLTNMVWPCVGQMPGVNCSCEDGRGDERWPLPPPVRTPLKRRGGMQWSEMS